MKIPSSNIHKVKKAFHIDDILISLLDLKTDSGLVDSSLLMLLLREFLNLRILLPKGSRLSGPFWRHKLWKILRHKLIAGTASWPSSLCSSLLDYFKSSQTVAQT